LGWFFQSINLAVITSYYVFDYKGAISHQFSVINAHFSVWGKGSKPHEESSDHRLRKNDNKVGITTKETVITAKDTLGNSIMY
jgi:hypothetical protein